MSANQRRYDFEETLNSLKTKADEIVQKYGCETMSFGVGYGVDNDLSLFLLIQTTEETFLTDEQMEHKETMAAFEELIKGLDDPEKKEKQEDKLLKQAEELDFNPDDFFN